MSNRMTAAAVIEALGGTNELAAALGVVPSAVRNWRRLGAFPKRLHIDIQKLAKRRKVKLDEALFQELKGPQRRILEAQARQERAVISA